MIELVQQEVDTPLGRFTLPVLPNDTIVQTILAGNIYDVEIIEAAKRYIPLGSTVVDVGACFGQLSVVFGNLVGSKGTVVVIEAQQACWEFLYKNLKNTKAQIVCCRFPAWSKSGVHLPFPFPDFREFTTLGSYGIDFTSKERNHYTSVTIDSLVLHSNHQVSFIKIDCQGADLEVLKGARETIIKHQPAFCFEYEEQFSTRFSTTLQDYLDFVSSVNYQVVEIVNQITYFCIPKNV